MYILYIYIYIYIHIEWVCEMGISWVHNHLYRIHTYIYNYISIQYTCVLPVYVCAYVYSIYIYMYLYIYIYMHVFIYIYIYPMIPRPYLPWPRLYQKWTTINGFWRLYGEFSSTIPVSHLRLYRQNINAYTGTVAICGPKDPDVDCWKPQVV